MKTIYTFNSKVLKNSVSAKWLAKKEVDPYNPLGLPSNTVRVKTSDGQPPIISSVTSYETATLVSGTNDVYDVYKSGSSFKSLVRNSTNVIEVLGANSTGITDMYAMFMNCSSLTAISLFDTSSVTDMTQMFYGCSSLTTVPLFNTSSVMMMNNMFYNCSSLTTIPLFNTSSVTKMTQMLRNCTSLTYLPLFNTSLVTNMDYAFINCYNVQSGALALYQQASTQANPPSHNTTFRDCGRDTQTGAAELAQIPSDWK